MSDRPSDNLDDLCEILATEVGMDYEDVVLLMEQLARMDVNSTLAEAIDHASRHLSPEVREALSPQPQEPVGVYGSLPVANPSGWWKPDSVIWAAIEEMEEVDDEWGEEWM